MKLKEDVFETETFKNWSGKKVILLELDYPKDGSQRPEIKQQNADLAEQYNIDSYPTVLLLDSNGEVLGKLDVKMTSAYYDVSDLSRKHKVSMRDAAYMLAIDRVAMACRDRGWV